MVMSPAGAEAGMLTVVELAARPDVDATVEDIRVDYGARQETATLLSESRGRDGNRTAEGHTTPGPPHPESHESHGEVERQRPCP